MHSMFNIAAGRLHANAHAFVTSASDTVCSHLRLQIANEH